MRKRIYLCGVALLLVLFGTAGRAFAQKPHRERQKSGQAHLVAKPQSIGETRVSQASGAQKQKVATPQTAPQAPTPALSDEVPCAYLSCAAFNRLIQAKDRTLSLNLYVTQAYACFSPRSDSFIVLAYNVSVVSLPENGEQVFDGWVASDRYENGEDADSNMALGEWRGTDSRSLQFHENSTSDNDSSLNVAISDSLFSFSRSYKTIEEKDVSLDLKISLPSLLFSESYSIDGQAQPPVENAPCWKYSLDSRVSDQPAPSSAAPASGSAALHNDTTRSN